MRSPGALSVSAPGALSASALEDPPARMPRHRRLRARGARLLADPLAPTVVLSLILVLSLYARVIDLGQPCKNPCRAGVDHTLIFDESYYVNAARVIAGVNPPVGAPYHGAPKGKDPNAEHPQLGKLVMAAGIKLFGDGPRGWRLGSVLFGLVALVALYALVRAAGGGPWLAVGATGVMALDNLLLVHGRIATLDIYAVAMMLVAATFYLRRSPLLAGLAMGVGGCMKEVALYLLFVLVLLEALRAARTLWARRVERRQDVERVQGVEPAQGEHGGVRSPYRATGWVGASLRPLMIFLAASVASFLGLLWLLDVLVPAYDPGTHTVYGGSPFTHLSHIYHYAQLLKSKSGATGIAATPWEWLQDQRTIDYARVAVNSVAHGNVVSSRALVYFKGEINPFIIFLAVPALFAALAAAWRAGDGVAEIGACWCLGAFLPFAIESQISGRITYLYYMVIVMPGLYLVVSRLFADPRMPRAAVLGWVVMLSFSFLNLYPLRMLL